MSKGSFRVTSFIPAPPNDVYAAWLDSIEHAKMTGGGASIEPTVGGRHSAWDGYIEGKNLELDPGRRILQSWRTKDFPDDAEDSVVEVVFEAHDDQTRVRIQHTSIPGEQAEGYERGWFEHYFQPMIAYFTSIGGSDDAIPETSPASKLARAAKEAKAVAKKALPKAASTTPATKTTKAASTKAVKKAAPKKSAAKATSKKAAPKRASASKTPAKKTAPKRAAAKKAAKKAPVKKATAKKATKPSGTKAKRR